jgi:hypothetical protein
MAKRDYPVIHRSAILPNLETRLRDCASCLTQMEALEPPASLSKLLVTMAILRHLVELIAGCLSDAGYDGLLNFVRLREGYCAKAIISAVRPTNLTL